MEDDAAYIPLGRQSGGRYMGNLYRGNCTAVGFRTNSSIPSRYETVLNTGLKERDGFGSQNPRFVGTGNNDLPGPGTYGKLTEMTYEGDVNKPGLSKKGYGAGFVSKNERFRDKWNALNVPGPGGYETGAPLLHSQTWGKNFNRQPVSRTFAGSRKAECAPPLEPNVAPKPVPGPGAYHESRAWVEQDEEKLAAFRSRTNRFGRHRAKVAGPAPGSYDMGTAFNPVKRNAASAVFKSMSGRSGDRRLRQDGGGMSAPGIIYGDEEFDPMGDSPGPGNYETGVFDVGQRAIEGPPGKHSSMFAAGVTDRFGNTVKPRVLRATVPGPGAYDVNKTWDAPAPVGVFVSTKERNGLPGVGGDSPFAAKPPGPAFYNPGDAHKKSFHLNARKRWM